MVVDPHGYRTHTARPDVVDPFRWGLHGESILVAAASLQPSVVEFVSQDLVCGRSRFIVEITGEDARFTTIPGKLDDRACLLLTFGGVVVLQMGGVEVHFPVTGGDSCTKQPALLVVPFARKKGVFPLDDGCLGQDCGAEFGVRSSRSLWGVNEVRAENRGHIQPVGEPCGLIDEVAAREETVDLLQADGIQPQPLDDPCYAFKIDCLIRVCPVMDIE